MCTSGNKITNFHNQKEVLFSLRALDGSCETPMIKACTVPQISGPIRQIPFSTQHFVHLKNIEFTEIYPSQTNLIPDVMIGEPLCSHLMIGSPILGSLNEPGAQKTRLGYTLIGAMPTASTGPKLLVQDRSFWPNRPDSTLESSKENSIASKTTNNLLLLTKITEEGFPFETLLERFSSWHSVVNTMTYIQRLRKSSRRQFVPKTLVISPE